jgi:acyl phosphate:glycerol-3-phosphate acyltransferase
VIDLLVALGLGYLVGSFPSAAIAARLRGARVFDLGSGNMGAMNVARNLGFGLGVAVLLADIGKGAAAAGIGLGMARLAALPPDARLALALAGGVGAVVGHAWSVYVRFRGGKALATAFGVALPVYPVAALITLGVLVALLLLLRGRATVAAVITVFAYPVIAYLAEVRAGSDEDRAFAVLTAVLLVSAVVLVKHLPRRAAGAG